MNSDFSLLGPLLVAVSLATFSCGGTSSTENPDAMVDQHVYQETLDQATVELSADQLMVPDEWAPGEIVHDAAEDLAVASDGEPADTVEFPPSPYPPLPDGATQAVFVNATADSAVADGSLEHPFDSVAAGVEAAVEGWAVLVAPGSYAENLMIGKGPLYVVGGGASGDLDFPVTLTPPGPDAAIYVDSAEGVVLIGLSIQSPTTAGIWVRSGSAIVDNCKVSGALETAQQQFGFGILGSEGAVVEISDSLIWESEGIGVHFSSSTGELHGCEVSENQGGGVRLESAEGTTVISDCAVQSNMQYGVGVFSAQALLTDNVISGTQAGAQDGIADGVVVAPLVWEGEGEIPPTALDLAGDNVLEGHERVGILFSGESLGSVDGASIADNDRAGIWLQGGAGGDDGIRIENNALVGNRFVGIGATLGARALVRSNEVSNTQLGKEFVGIDMFDVGDGVGVYGGAAVLVLENVLSDNGRVGLLLDSPMVGDSCTPAQSGFGTGVCGNQVSGNEDGVVLQNSANGQPIFDSNALSQNVNGDEIDVKALDEALVPLQTEAANGFDGGGAGMCMPPSCLD
jgi:hypothetical protein